MLRVDDHNYVSRFFVLIVMVHFHTVIRLSPFSTAIRWFRIDSFLAVSVPLCDLRATVLGMLLDVYRSLCTILVCV